MANEIRIIRTDKEQPPLAIQILDALRNIINPAKEDGNLASLVAGQGKVLAGKSRIGSITISRNASNYITQIVIVEGGTTRTLTITRGANNYITGISEAIS